MLLQRLRLTDYAVLGTQKLNENVSLFKRIYLAFLRLIKCCSGWV